MSIHTTFQQTVMKMMIMIILIIVLVMVVMIKYQMLLKMSIVQRILMMML